MNYLLYVAILSLFTLLYTGCMTSATPLTSRDYNISITSKNMVHVDSIIVEVEADGSKEIIKLISPKDINQNESKLTALFTVHTPNDTASISYKCYSLDLVFISKSEIISINEGNTLSPPVLHMDIIEELVKFQKYAATNNILHRSEQNKVLNEQLVTRSVNSEHTAIYTYRAYDEVNKQIFLNKLITKLSENKKQNIVEYLSTISNKSPDSIESLLQNHPIATTKSTLRFTISGSIIKEPNQYINKIRYTLNNPTFDSALIALAVFDSNENTFSGYFDLDTIDGDYTLNVDVLDWNDRVAGRKTLTLTEEQLSYTLEPMDAENAVSLFYMTASKPQFYRDDSIQFTINYTPGVVAVKERYYQLEGTTEWVAFSDTDSLVIKNNGTLGYTMLNLWIIYEDGFEETYTTNYYVLNNYPKFIVPERTFYIQENTTGAIGQISAIDNDSKDTLRYFITDDKNHTAINTTTGEISVIKPFDFEESDTYTIIVRATDGIDTIETGLLINIINNNDNTPVLHEKDTINIALQDRDSLVNFSSFDQDNDELKLTVVYDEFLVTHEIFGTNSIYFRTKPSRYGKDTLMLLLSDSLYTDTVVAIISVVDIHTMYNGTPYIEGDLNEGETIAVIPGGECVESNGQKNTLSYTWYAALDSNSGRYVIPNQNDSLLTIDARLGGYFLYAEVNCWGNEPLSKGAYSKRRAYFKNKTTEKGLTDTRDSKTYNTVAIGSQVWMASNLDFDPKDSLSFDGRCYGGTCKNYSNLYSYDAVTGSVLGYSELCPSGWSIPTLQDWLDLADYIVYDKRLTGDPNINYMDSVGEYLKTGYAWELNDKKSYLGFDAYPEGMSNIIDTITFAQKDEGSAAYYWLGDNDLYNNGYTSGTLSGISLKKENSDYNMVAINSFMYLSIRCIKDREYPNFQ